MNKSGWNSYWDEFHSSLNSIGIVPGDIVYVSSDIMKVLAQAAKEFELVSKEDRNYFLDALIDEIYCHVGDAGTVLFPVYSWAFCKGQPFDYKKTQGEVGALNNYVLNYRSDYIRTKHPMYSFMVRGKYANYLFEMNNQDAWGEGSPFSFLHKMGAKELGLSLPLVRTLTFKHYVEQMINVPYRYPKYFLAHYVDHNGVEEVRSYSMLVRDLSVSLHSCQELDFFLKQGVAKKKEFRGWEMFSLEYEKAFRLIKDDFIYNGGKNFYQFEGYEINWETNNNRYEIGLLKDSECLSIVQKND